MQETKYGIERINETSIITHFKMRAEYSHDIMEFLKKAFGAMQSFNFQKDQNDRNNSLPVFFGFPDCEIDFTTHATLLQILKILNDIPDSHVMYQTLKPIEDYTGERVYGLDLDLFDSDLNGFKISQYFLN